MNYSSPYVDFALINLNSKSKLQSNLSNFPINRTCCLDAIFCTTDLDQKSLRKCNKAKLWILTMA